MEKQNIVKKNIFSRTSKPEILLIGTSTGGPQALQKIIPKLEPIGIPIIIVQHMPKGFTKSLAKSLNIHSKIPVKEAEFGEELKSDNIYVAPGGQEHSFIQKKFNKISIQSLANEEAKKFYIPSVDIMSESIADVYGENSICVILTGMGDDGLLGFKKAKEKGAYIIAESEKTAIVYGMPRVVIEANLADEILPLNDISASIMKIFQN